MKRIEILVEEKSMEELLSIFLPRVLSSEWRLGDNYFIRAFEGKTDLQKSLPKKIKAFSHWHEPIGIIILQDQDSADCKILKSKLEKIITDNGNPPHLIRIVCKELESWYLGDLEAIKKAYPNFKLETYQQKAKFRNPDICNASNELKKILPEFQKVGTAIKVAAFLDSRNNKSESFQQFVSGVKNFVTVKQNSIF